MIEVETVFIDTFRSDVGEFRTTFTQGGCELQYPHGSGRRVFRSRADAHAAVGRQQTGYQAWDELPAEAATEQAYTIPRWTRSPMHHIRQEGPTEKPYIESSADYPSIPLHLLHIHRMRPNQAMQRTAGRSDA